MSRSDYHHGDLYNAALAEAEALVTADGVEALRMRRLAENLGVNHRALYRHFGNKRGLLCALACRAFETLTQQAAEAAEREPEPRNRAVALMGAYADFALGAPELYRLMYGLGVGSLQQEPELWSQVHRLVMLCQREFMPLYPELDKEALRDRIIGVWGLTHGLVELYASGSLRAVAPELARTYIVARIEEVLPAKP